MESRLAPVPATVADATAPAGTAARGVALVTGGARRLGRAIALALARDGWDVAVHYRASRAEAEATVAEIVALGRRAAAVAADLEVEAEVAALHDACAAALGPARCVVNNASLFEYDVAADFSYALLERHARANLAAPMLLARELHRRLPANPRPSFVASRRNCP